MYFSPRKREYWIPISLRRPFAASRMLALSSLDQFSVPLEMGLVEKGHPAKTLLTLQ